MVLALVAVKAEADFPTSDEWVGSSARTPTSVAVERDCIVLSLRLRDGKLRASLISDFIYKITKP